MARKKNRKIQKFSLFFSSSLKSLRPFPILYAEEQEAKKEEKVEEKEDAKQGEWTDEGFGEVIEGPEKERCENLVYGTLTEKWGQKPQFIWRAIQKKGCPLSLNFIRCVHCTQLRANGGVVFKKDGDMEIQLCQNHLTSKDLYQQTLAHELIHVYDYCSGDMDLGDITHQACTEIRAQRLSDACRYWKEWRYNIQHGKLGADYKECVRRRTTRSMLTTNPDAPKEIATAIDYAWNKCSQDNSPFHELPHPKNIT